MDLYGDAFERINAASEIKVVDRQDSGNQNPPSYPNHDKKKHKEEAGSDNSDRLPEYDDSQWIQYNLELGRLIIEKKNLEISLYSEERKSGSRDYVASKIELIKKNISELENKIVALDFSSLKLPESPVDDVNTQIKYLSKLHRLYNVYLEITSNETSAIEEEDLDTLQLLMEQKSTVLDSIHTTQNNILFDVFKKMPEKTEKRTKADAILTDINVKIKQIIDSENKNSVELENQKEELRLRLGKKSIGTRAISKYASAHMRSHFIDTTK